MTIDPTAKLSPGRLHATLTGSVSCDNFAGPTSLNGQIVQPGGTGGYGFIAVACDGTPHLFTMDVSTAMGMTWASSRLARRARRCLSRPAARWVRHHVPDAIIELVA